MACQIPKMSWTILVAVCGLNVLGATVLQGVAAGCVQDSVGILNFGFNEPRTLRVYIACQIICQSCRHAGSCVILRQQVGCLCNFNNASKVLWKSRLHEALFIHVVRVGDDPAVVGVILVIAYCLNAFPIEMVKCHIGFHIDY